MKLKKKLTFLILFWINVLVWGQETLPIYQDYLSDNVYLVHPAAAGIGECGKIRVTARTQWLDIPNAPQLQTASFHAKFKEDSRAAYGFILFNDKNGYHSQKGLQATYAYHLPLDNSNKFNQLSFGLSLSGVFNEVDQRSFDTFDPEVQQIIQSDFYVNADFGMSYHFGGFFSYLTIKNIFLSAKNSLTSEFEALNLRNYVYGLGNFFGDKERLQYEPSLMFQYKDQTTEKIADFNLKVYKQMQQTQLWAGVSYRTSFDGNSFENAQYFSPIVGLNYQKFMVSYTYTKQMGDVLFSDDGFHQISLGLNLLCTKRRLSACPNINGQLF